MSDIAKGGTLRVDKRTKRGQKNERGEDIVGEEIIHGLDAYTVEESDLMDKRICVTEAQLSANGAIAIALKRVGNDIEELQNQMLDRQEAEAELRKLQEENSSAAGQLKKKIVLAKEKWLKVAEDVNFGLDHYNDQKGLDHQLDDEDADADEEDEDDEDLKEPIIVTKLGRLYSDVEAALNNSFEMRETVEDTLEILCPKLDKLTLQVEEIHRLDKAIRLGSEAAGMVKGKTAPGANKDIDETALIEGETVCLNDVMCIDRTFGLFACLQDAHKCSIPVVDEMVDKIGMRRRIQGLEDQAVSTDIMDAIEKSTEEVCLSLSLSLSLEGYCSILVASRLMWSGALDSSSVLLPYSIISLA